MAVFFFSLILVFQSASSCATGIASKNGVGEGVLKRLTAVPADEEDGVKVFGVADELFEFLRLLEERFLLVQEVHRYLVVFVDGAGVQGRFAAGGGGDGDLSVRGELLVWVCEFGLGGIVSFVSVVKAREWGLRG